MPTPLTSLLQSKLSSCSTRVRTWDTPEPKKQKSARHFRTNRKATRAKQWPRPLKSIFPQFILPRNALISWLLCLLPAINSVAWEFYFITLTSRVRSILAIFNWLVRKNTQGIPHTAKCAQINQDVPCRNTNLHTTENHFLKQKTNQSTTTKKPHKTQKPPKTENLQTKPTSLAVILDTAAKTFVFVSQK